MKELERYRIALNVAMLAYRGAASWHVEETDKKIEAILNPPPEYEEVEVVSWAIIAPSGFVETTSVNEGLQRDQVANVNSPFYGYQVAKLTGTRKRLKPQKVEKSVSVQALLKPNGEPVPVKDDRQYPFHEVQGNFPPMTGGELTFTWTE